MINVKNIIKDLNTLGSERVASRESGTIWGDPDEYKDFAKNFDNLLSKVSAVTLEDLYWGARYGRKHGFGLAWPIFDAVEDLVSWICFGYGPEELPTKRKIRALRIIESRVDRVF